MVMNNILVIGAGEIGSLIALLLADSKDYFIYLADVRQNSRYSNLLSSFQNIQIVELDAQNTASISAFLLGNKQIKAIVSCLPFYCNFFVAEMAAKFKLHYFDLTEDIKTAQTIQEIAENSNGAFVPQCGLAPGFISIIANHMIQRFSSIDSVKLRVGALPTNTSNILQYSLTWSTDGLINEYGNKCEVVKDGVETTCMPLEDLEEIKIDGLTYEAFNTSGGIGSLAKTYCNKVRHLNYKTIRYPGHCEKMYFLMNHLNLNKDRETLKRILENTLPKTYQDVVLVYVSVTGAQQDRMIEENYVKKFYPKTNYNFIWSAIQQTTASSLCAVLDLVMSAPNKYRGFICQEQFLFDEVKNNRFGQYYA